VLVGKATDRSGFGGASFSSLTLDEDDAEANKGAVQVPDPFLKNVIMRASYAVFAALREQGLTVGFKDLGAGGLAGCSAELCAAGGVGAEVELERVSTAQRDLPPEVIAIGETQERLCWIVPPSFTPTLLAIYNEMYSLPRIARGACAAVIGKVTDTGRYVARYRNETVMDVDLEFLTGGVRYSRPYVLPEIDTEAPREGQARIERALAARPQPLLERLRAVLAHRDVSSRSSIYQRYDGVVRGCTALPPGYADAGVLVPVPGAPLGVAVGIGGNPRYGKLDPRRAAELAVIEAIGNVTAVGAEPAGLTDCLNFGDPTIPEQMGAFVAAIDGLSESARALGVPFVSGNVSLYNRSSSGNHVAPSPIVGCIGTIADVSVTSSMALKRVGSPIVVMQSPSWAGELGGSVLAELLDVDVRALPPADVTWFSKACAFVRQAIARNLVLTARDISDGGYLAAVAEMALAATAAPIGVRVGEFGPLDARSSASRFAETPGFVLEVGDFDGFVALAGTYGLPFRLDMQTIAEPCIEHIDEHEHVVGRIDLTELREAWEAPLRDFYGASSGSA
jgi:phosphoribosylformylglycinamidine synthase